MKVSRFEKLKMQLEAVESQLFHMLGQALPRAAHSGEMLFFNSEFGPDTILAHWHLKDSETLLSLAKESVLLREKVGLPVLGSAGQLYLSACAEAANAGNENRRGPRQLAAWLLGELERAKLA